MKLGRNSPCWCGSGKKYKKCHLHRESQEKVSQGKLISKINRHNRTKKCSVPASLNAECNGRIIQAHTLSKSSSLKAIAEENVVMGLKSDPGKHFKSNFDLEPTEIGINKASTFTGFCAYHDAKIFSPIENTAFYPSRENCFLLAYRAVARELYLKESAKAEAVALMKEMDSGQSLEHQIHIQMIARDFETGTDMALEDLSRVKHTLDKILESGNQALLKHYVFVLEPGQKIASSGSIIIDYDFNANELQDLRNRNLSSIIFNCFPGVNEGYFIFTWLSSEDAVARAFINSLINKNSIGDRLTSFLFSYCENNFVTPSWWRDLPDESKKRLKERILDGLKNEITPKILRSDNINYMAMEVTNKYEI